MLLYSTSWSIGCSALRPLQRLCGISAVAVLLGLCLCSGSAIFRAQTLIWESLGGSSRGSRGSLVVPSFGFGLVHEGAPVARLVLGRSSVAGYPCRLPAYEEAQKKECCCVLRVSAILRCYCNTVLYGVRAALLCNVGCASCMSVRVVRGCIQCDVHGCAIYVQRVVWMCSRGRHKAAQVMQCAYDRSIDA